MQLIRNSLVKSLILFRIRVNDTKLPYLWLFLPVLLRVAPFALLVLALSSNEMGLRFVQVTMMAAPCSILLRRVFRIRALHGRLPEWLNSGTTIPHTLFSFALLTFLESLFPVFLISIGVYFSTSRDLLVAIRFLLIALLMLILGLLVVVLVCPAILVAYEKYEDVRHGTRHSFMIMNALLMLGITLKWSSIPLLAVMPGMFFVNLTGVPYGDPGLLTLLVSSVTLIILVFVLAKRFPMTKINEIQDQTNEGINELL